MSNSPPTAKGGGRGRRSTTTAAKGGRSSSSSRAKSSTPGGGKNKKNNTCNNMIDLTAFGFSSTRVKKRPAPVNTATAAASASSAAAGADDDDDIVEIVTSPTKRSRHSTGTSSALKTTTTSRLGGGSKVGSGKENGTTTTTFAKAPAVSSSAAATTSATPAKKSGGDSGKQRKAAASATTTSNNNSGGSRVALLDLTQDSSSDNSMERGKKKPAAAVVVAAEAASKTTTTTATATLSGMGGAIASKILATTATGAAAQRQRRGKRDKQPAAASATKPQQQQGMKRSGGSVDAPIAIFEDEVVVVAPSSGGQKKARQDNNNNSSNTNNSNTNTNNALSLGNTKTPMFEVGTIVQVQDRTWPGRNDQGGVARILRVHLPAAATTVTASVAGDQMYSGSSDGTIKYDVRYILESRREKGVEEHFIELHSEYVSPSKKSNAQNGVATKRSTPARVTRGKIPGKYKSSSSSPKPLLNSPGKRKKALQQQKNKALSSPEQLTQPLARGGSIQSYFSPTKSANTSPKVSTCPKQDEEGKKSPKVTNTNTSPKGTSPTTTRQQPVHALGLVRVSNPHSIACTTAVANARNTPFHPNNEISTNNAAAAAVASSNDAQQQHRPFRIFPGAILGRPSNSKKKKRAFVDLGIPNCKAISRSHLKVLTVKGLVNDSPETSQESSMPLSQTSTASTAAMTEVSPPTLLLQVDEKCVNGVHIFSTRRGEKRNSLFLEAGQQKSLRIGDAILFPCIEKFTFCVVGLVYATNNDGGGDNKEWDAVKVGEEDAARILEFTPPQMANKKAAPIARASSGGGNVTVRERRKNSSSVVAAPSKSQEEDEVVEVSLLDNENNDGKAKKNTASSSNGKTMEMIEIDDDDDKITEFEMKMASKEKTVVASRVEQPLQQPHHHHPPLIEQEANDGKLSPTSTTEVVAAAASTAMLMMSVSSSTAGTPAAAMSPKSTPDLDATMELDDAMVRGDACTNNNNSAAGVDVEAATKKSNDVMDLAVADSAMVAKEASATEKKVGVVVPIINKGDDVKVYYDTKDMFGVIQKEWYFGTAIEVVKPNSSSSTIRVQFDDMTFDTFSYPCEDLEKLPTSKHHSPEHHPTSFHVGDIVDAQFQNGSQNGKWYRGRVANCKGGDVCDVFYYDGEHESNIPTKEKKVRLIQRCDSGEWLVGKSATLKCSNDGSFQTGEVSKLLGCNNYQVTFADRSSEMVNYEEAAKAVFANLLEDLPSKMQHIWPVSMSTSMADTVRLRRQRRDQKKVIDESSGPTKKPVVKAEPKHTGKSNGRTRSARSTTSHHVSVKAEPVDEEPLDNATDDIDNAWLNEHDDDAADLCLDIKQGGPAVDPSILEMRKVAKDFPPSLPNVLWCALNSPEAQTGSNFLRDLLCVHDSAPPSTMVQKLMDLMKYGPKAEGSSVYFKDPHRTELAAQYVYGLVAASSRLVRRDASALFGPSSWDDIEVLLSQSIVETENMISGRRLAQGLQVAARGAKLLSLMLTTEVQGHDLYHKPSSVSLDSTALKSMPSIRLIKSYGARSGLKSAVRHVTKCLVRHSRWILDQGGQDTPYSISDECCFLEAKACLDNLGSSLGIIAWLFCVEERVDISHPTCAFVIKDEFLVEMERSLVDELPEMNERTKKKFVKNLKMYFVMSLAQEDFVMPMVMTLGKMIGVEDELALIGLVA